MISFIILMGFDGCDSKNEYLNVILSILAQTDSTTSSKNTILQGINNTYIIHIYIFIDSLISLFSIFESRFSQSDPKVESEFF